MKVEHKKTFAPFTITIEDAEEAAMLCTMMRFIKDDFIGVYPHGSPHAVMAKKLLEAIDGGYKL